MQEAPLATAGRQEEDPAHRMTGDTARATQQAKDIQKQPMGKNNAAVAEAPAAAETDAEDDDDLDLVAPRKYESPDGICELQLVRTEPYTSKIKDEETGETKETKGKKLFVRVLEVLGDPDQTAKFGPGGAYGEHGMEISSIIGSLTLTEPSGRSKGSTLTRWAKGWFKDYKPNRTLLSFKRVIDGGATVKALVQPDEKTDGRTFAKVLTESIKPGKQIPAIYAD